MRKVKNTIKAYINKNLDHSDQFEKISSRLNLQKIEKKQENSFMKLSKALKIVVPLVVLIVIIGIIAIVGPFPKVNASEGAAVIQMDVNPSISFVVDDDGTVISVYGENDEGKMIIDGETIVGEKLEDAIEIIINIEAETGYLLRGKVSKDSNNISISIEADNKKIAEVIQNKVEKSVNEICDKLNIEEQLEIAKTNAKEKLVTRALAIDPTLTSEQANNMTNEDLIKYISVCQIEKIDIPTKEIEELYNKVKYQKIQLVEKEETKVIIDKLDDAYQAVKEGYNGLYQALLDAQVNLNDTYVKWFISEDSEYQKALKTYQDYKLEVLKLENEISQMEDGLEKTIKEGILEANKKILEGYLVALNITKEAANTIVTTLSNIIDQALNNMEQFLSELPTEIKTEINESLTNLEVKLNTAKDSVFKEFEEKYKEQIEFSKKQVQEYKDNLVNQLK